MRHVSRKEGTLTLLELPAGEAASIHTLHREDNIRRRIQSLGLFEGRRVCVVARGPFSGPLLVEDLVSGARVMIARGLAAQIEVTGDPSRGS